MTVYITHDDYIIIDKVEHLDSFEFTWVSNGKYKFETTNIKPEMTDIIWIGIHSFKNHGGYTDAFDDFFLGWIWDSDLLEDGKINRFLTSNQIRCFINFFFAIHGYDFQDQIYKKFFQLYFRNSIQHLAILILTRVLTSIL